MNVLLGDTSIKMKLNEVMKENPVKGTVIGKDEDGNWRLGVYDAISKQTRVFENTIDKADDSLVCNVGKDAIREVMNFMYDVADIENDEGLKALHASLEPRIVGKYKDK